MDRHTLFMLVTLVFTADCQRGTCGHTYARMIWRSVAPCRESLTLVKLKELSDGVNPSLFTDHLQVYAHFCLLRDKYILLKKEELTTCKKKDELTTCEKYVLFRLSYSVKAESGFDDDLSSLHQYVKVVGKQNISLAEMAKCERHILKVLDYKLL